MSTCCPGAADMQGSMLPSEVAALAGAWPGFMSKPTTVTSSPVRMKVLAERVLLLPSGSAVADDTDALLVMTSETVEEATAWIVIVTLPPGTRLPRLHVTVPAASPHEPWLAFAETNVTCEGRVSVATTPVALDG